ncbi:MAG TPA: hypothetical protein VN397_00630 [Candidatus Methylomirabilis sp.]|nr:hypothetical protein [Candidatus Methylomirabilis sp.]
MRRFSIVCTLVLTGCASPSPRIGSAAEGGASVGRSAHATRSPSDPEEFFRISIRRFNGIVRRHKRTADAYEPRADLSLPTASIECEMERLRAVLAILGVMQANAKALAAALVVGQIVAGPERGIQQPSVVSALDAYDQSVVLLQHTVVEARRQESAFLDCVPLTLYMAAP